MDAGTLTARYPAITRQMESGHTEFCDEAHDGHALSECPNFDPHEFADDEWLHDADHLNGPVDNRVCDMLGCPRAHH